MRVAKVSGGFIIFFILISTLFFFKKGTASKLGRIKV